VGLATTVVAVSGVTAIGHVTRRAPVVVQAAEAAVAVEAPKGPAPVVTAVGSKDLRMSDTPQLIGVTGSGFVQGITATLVAPLGLATTYAAASLQNLTPTSFGLSMLLDEPGTYTLTVRDPSGERSNTVQLIVKAAK
jgi:hypothetical protein